MAFLLPDKEQNVSYICTEHVHYSKLLNLFSSGNKRKFVPACKEKNETTLESKYKVN